jgi:hypothetical protein
VISLASLQEQLGHSAACLLKHLPASLQYDLVCLLAQACHLVLGQSSLIYVFSKICKSCDRVAIMNFMKFFDQLKVG